MVEFIETRKIMFDSLAKSKNIKLVFDAECEGIKTAVDELKMEKIIDKYEDPKSFSDNELPKKENQNLSILENLLEIFSNKS